jgi:hypothetical protein
LVGDVIQRPTPQKRNVVDHLPQEHKADVRRKLQDACSMADYANANARWNNGITS